jgi:hypothetical protein
MIHPAQCLDTPAHTLTSLAKVTISVAYARVMPFLQLCL